MKITKAKEILRKQNIMTTSEELFKQNELLDNVKSILEDFTNDLYFHDYTLNSSDLADAWKNGVYVDVYYHKFIKNPILNFFRIVVKRIKIVTIKAVYDEDFLRGFRYSKFYTPYSFSALVEFNNEIDIAKFVVTVEERLSEVL